MDLTKILQITFLCLTIVVLLGGIVYAAITFFRMPKSKQIATVKQWLIYACMEAEKLLGSKTGLLKLRYVYDLFVTKFPWLAQIISFEYFSSLVDEALETVRKQLESNPVIKNLIIGDNANDIQG